MAMTGDTRLQPIVEPMRHTPAPWESQSFDPDENGIALIGLPMNGMVAWVTLHPTEMDTQDPTRAEANAAFIVDCVNSHAFLKARIEELEAGEKALRDELWQLRQIVTDVRIMANAGNFKKFEGEPWLLRVSNIDLHHDPVATAAAFEAQHGRT